MSSIMQFFVFVFLIVLFCVLVLLVTFLYQLDVSGQGSCIAVWTWLTDTCFSVSLPRALAVAQLQFCPLADMI